MSDDSTTQCLLFPGIFHKPVLAQFDQREGSSDGGALLLKAADRHYGLVAGLSSCLRDDRQAGKVDHWLRELVAQRVFSIACGYPDANDSARLYCRACESCGVAKASAIFTRLPLRAGESMLSFCHALLDCPAFPDCCSGTAAIPQIGFD